MCHSAACSHNLLTCTTICLDVIARQTVASLAGTAVRALCVIAHSIWTAGVGIGALVHICNKCAQVLTMETEAELSIADSTLLQHWPHFCTRWY
jgi:hypothetical protein